MAEEWSDITPMNELRRSNVGSLEERESQQQSPADTVSQIRNAAVIDEQGNNHENDRELDGEKK
jgi:hypothetical protein